jgi:hypothetical protein
LSYGGELGECGLEVLDDLLRDHLRRWQVVGVLERFVPEPGDVEAGLLPCDELVIAEAPEPLGLLPSGAVVR